MLQRMTSVLGVPGTQRGDGHVVLPGGGRTGLDELPAAIQSEPSERRPVLRPGVDQQRHVWVGGDVANALQIVRIGDALGLFIQRRPDAQGPVGGLEREADRDESRPAICGHRPQDGRPGRGKEDQFSLCQSVVGHHRRMMHPRLSAMADLLPPTREVTTTRIVAVRGAELEYRADRVVGEEPLEIRAAGPGQDPVAVAITMRTPGFEDELAVGFLRTEGLIEGPEVLKIERGDPSEMNQPDDRVTVRLARPFDASVVAERHFVATASCGICGKASLDEVAVRSDPLPPGPLVERRVILALPDLLRAAQRAFDETGGLHAAGLFTPTGELLEVREDVGRHNALDKLVGSQVLAKAMPLHERILVVSGRVSFEIVQKAAVAGIPIICAVSAPSDLAVEAADRLGVTLVGFLRGDGFNIYAHDERIDLGDLLGLG